MRGLALVLLVACRTASTCDTPACAEACAQAEERLRALVPPGGDLLSPQEARVLAPELEQIRTGVRPGPDALRICRGASTCETPLPATDTRPAEGEYVVLGKVLVPPIGTWTVEFWKVCERDHVEVERSGGPRPVQAKGEDGVVDLGVLDRLRVGPRRSTSHETACTYTLKSTEGARPFELKRMVTLPGSSN